LDEGAAGGFEWTVHPFRERRRLGVAVLVFILAAGVGGGLWARGWYWGLFCFLVLFLSLESFYFPTRFRLEETKLVVSRRFSRSEREWGIFRKCTVDSDGLTLSPYRRPTWVEPYRVIRIRFGGDRTDGIHREAVIAYVRERLGPDIDWSEGREWNRKRAAT
jgi:hypothetical protein